MSKLNNFKKKKGKSSRKKANVSINWIRFRLNAKCRLENREEQAREIIKEENQEIFTF